MHSFPQYCTLNLCSLKASLSQRANQQFPLNLSAELHSGQPLTLLLLFSQPQSYNQNFKYRKMQRQNNVSHKDVYICCKNNIKLCKQRNTLLKTSIHPSSSTYPGSGSGGRRLSTTAVSLSLSSSSWGVPMCSQAGQNI